MRGCGGTQGFFRGNVTGSDKRHPFCIPAEKEEASTLALYESPIDAMSDASLRIRRGAAWREQHYLSLDGLSMLPIETFLKSHPGVTHLRICTDNDKAGGNMPPGWKKNMLRGDIWWKAVSRMA